MFYSTNNPITQFLDTFYDRSDIGIRQLDPQDQFNSVRSGVREFDQYYKQSVFQQILERIAGTIDSRAALFSRLRKMTPLLLL